MARSDTLGQGGMGIVRLGTQESMGRSVAVKTYLVNETGLGADRAVIEQVSADDEAHQFSGVELGIEN